MAINVGNNTAQTATIVLSADGKLRYSDEASFSNQESIGATSAVSDELNALIGG